MTFDTEEIRRNTDLLALIGRDTTLKRVASTKGGEYAGPCPFCGGEDRFRVWPKADRPGWWCRQCEKRGDVIAYIQQRDGTDFITALRQAQDTACQYLGGGLPKPRPVARASPEPVNEEWQSAAVQIMVECAAALWEPEGERARRWLNERGLADETLKRYFIGFNRTSRMLHGLWVPQGITIPHWQESLNRIWGIKIRLPTNGPDKYRAVKGSVPCLYLADNLMGHEVAVICEGEFDALLLAQEVGDPSTGSPRLRSGQAGQALVGVVALGSAANKVKAIDAALPFLLEVKRLLVATDNDEEGKRAAAYLLERTKRARRLRVPQGNDVTDFWKGGRDLREWVSRGLEHGLLG